MGVFSGAGHAMPASQLWSLTMLLGYFMRTKKRATVVREVFREYMESCRENAKIELAPLFETTG